LRFAPSGLRLLFKVPRLNLRISRSTSFDAPREDFLAISNPPLGIRLSRLFRQWIMEDKR